MAKYKAGQFVSTPIGRMKVRKSNRIDVCNVCEIKSICTENNDLFNFCTYETPPFAYLEKPKNRGGKSTTSK